MNVSLVQFFISVLTPLLQMFVKSPKSIAAERTAITLLRDTCNQILAGIPAPTPRVKKIK